MADLREWKTPKGTTLYIMDLRGKDYLQVQWRIVWFREERPTWGIETRAIHMDGTSAVFQATIKDDSGRVVAMGTKSETKQGFPDFIEKAETGAIGRALAMCGFGTQFTADELDEGVDRLADAPVDKPAVTPMRSYSTSGPEGLVPPKESANWVPKLLPRDQVERVVRQGVDPGAVVITFGKKYKGRRLSEVSVNELRDYVYYIYDTANKKKEQINPAAQAFIDAVSLHLSTLEYDLPTVEAFPA